MALYETQRDKMSKVLLQLSLDVTAKDRETARQELSISAGTISQYLLGKVKSNDTAVSLIKVFRRCIAERQNIIDDTKA